MKKNPLSSSPPCFQPCLRGHWFIYLINQVASPRAVGLILLLVIPQKGSSDIPKGWNHRTSAQVWVSGRDETKLKSTIKVSGCVFGGAKIKGEKKPRSEMSIADRYIKHPWHRDKSLETPARNDLSM